MKKIAVIFGTRPEAIKLCPLIATLRETARFTVEVCVTGQHQTMLEQILQIFQVTPEANLALMEVNQTLAALTVKAIAAIDEYLSLHRPDLVIVQGDTTTALCAALAAYYHKIPVAHVEAGLRTGDRYAPYPEEVNRKLIGTIAVYHFTPTETSRKNLLAEGVPSSAIFVTGNTVIDALLFSISIVRNSRPLIAELPLPLNSLDNCRKMVLITGHRRENFGKGLRDICAAIGILARRFIDVDFVYPVHLNPNVRGPVKEMLSGYRNIHLIAPLDYLQFISLLDKCTFVLTDSGGIQEEAPTLGKPVLVMRNSTERSEAIEAGAVRLVGTETKRIVENVANLLEDATLYNTMAQKINPYGDGLACQRITDIIIKKYAGQSD